MDGVLLSQRTLQCNFLHVLRLLLDGMKTVGLLGCHRNQQTSTDSMGEEFHDSYNNLRVLLVVLFVQQHLMAFERFISERSEYDFKDLPYPHRKRIFIIVILKNFQLGVINLSEKPVKACCSLI